MTNVASDKQKRATGHKQKKTTRRTEARTVSKQRRTVQREQQRAAEHPQERSLEAQVFAQAAEKCDTQILVSLTQLARVTTELQEELADCTHFVFFHPKYVARLIDEGHGLAAGLFWRTYSQLLIYCIKTEAAAVSKLSDTLLWSIASENEIGMALSGRAIIEHAAATYALSKVIEPVLGRLKSDVWPAYIASLLSPPPHTTEDEKIRARLIKFAVGRRVQLNGPLPLLGAGAAAWKQFNDAIQQVPDDEKSTNILTELDKLTKDRVAALRVVYDFLSEYCHPNSSSRAFDFLRSMDAETHRAHLFGGKASAGFHALASLLNAVIPQMCSALVDALSLLAQARQPMPPLSDGSSHEPFPGAMPVVDDFGRPFWMAPEDITLPDIAGIKLTDEQAKRATVVYTTFSEFLAAHETAEDWVVELGKEGNPEKEIEIWEGMAEAYRTELHLRGDVEADVRELLYSAVINAGNGASLEDLPKLDPRLIQLPDLERTFWAVVRAMQNRGRPRRSD